MNRFREKFKITDFRPKMTHLHHFGHNKNFPKNPKQSLLTTFNACHKIKFQEKLTKQN